MAGKLVVSINGARIKGHSVIPAPCTTRTQSERAASSVWLGRTLLHLIMSELADASGKSDPLLFLSRWRLANKQPSQAGGGGGGAETTWWRALEQQHVLLTTDVPFGEGWEVGGCGSGQGLTPAGGCRASRSVPVGHGPQTLLSGSKAERTGTAPMDHRRGAPS